MTKTQIIDCLTVLANEQQSCSPIELSIGFTNKENIVNHEHIVIKECAPVVIEKLIKQGFMVSMTKQGLIIDKL